MVIEAVITIDGTAHYITSQESMWIHAIAHASMMAIHAAHNSENKTFWFFAPLQFKFNSANKDTN